VNFGFAGAGAFERRAAAFVLRAIALFLFGFLVVDK
jgi:hypothetical protein